MSRKTVIRERKINQHMKANGVDRNTATVALQRGRQKPPTSSKTHASRLRRAKNKSGQDNPKMGVSDESSAE